jgi:hypothetical protein
VYYPASVEASLRQQEVLRAVEKQRQAALVSRINRRDHRIPRIFDLRKARAA